MKTLKSLSVLTAAVLSNSLSLNAASDAANKPNFVIIFCDDMGYGDLSCYGNPTIRTPNIDRMACEGMKLTQFYVGAGVSTPSRAALMTGRLPVRNGLYGDRVAVLFPNSKHPIRQQGEQHLGTVQRRDWHQIEKAQTDGIERLRDGNQLP